jgi:catechol 2,3-dioxygenase
MHEAESASAVAAAATATEPPPSLRLGPVHLTVTDLDRSIGFYERSIGLRVHRRGGAVAALGAGERDLVVLVSEPAARPAGRHAGLYHVALLHPSRLELARAAARLAVTRTAILGASDHDISEAIYLPDPDGNEIELAADRPREVWPDLADPGWDGGPKPLDLRGLLDMVAREGDPAGADPALAVGHVHLYVGDVWRAVAFYRDVLGFEVMTRLATAAFLSVDGYHHHVAVNVWRGVGVPPAPAGTVGLRHWTIELPSEAHVAEAAGRAAAAGVAASARDGGLMLRDPWDIAVLLTAAAGDRPAPAAGPAA